MPIFCSTRLFQNAVIAGLQGKSTALWNATHPAESKTNPSPRPPQRLYRSSYVSSGQLVPPTLPRPVVWLICAKNNIKHQPTNLGFIVRLSTLDERGLLFAKSRQGHFHGLDGLGAIIVDFYQWPFPYSSGNTCKEK